MSATAIVRGEDSTDFAVVYDGPGVGNGSMSVRTLAPALLALADAFREVNEIVTPGGPDVSLNIRASEKGSFEVHLALAQLIAPTVTLLASQPATATANLFSLILGPSGIYDLVKRARNRVPAKQEATSSGRVRLTFPEGDAIEVPTAVLRAQSNLIVRRRIREVVAPLEQGAVDEVRFVRDVGSETSVTVTSQDLPAFELPTIPQSAPLVSQTVTMALAIVSLSYRPGLKWRLSDGDQTYTVDIEDEAFWQGVHDRTTTFREGDTMLCSVRFETYRDRSGELRTQRTVVKVLDFVPALQSPGDEPLFDG